MTSRATGVPMTPVSLDITAQVATPDIHTPKTVNVPDRQQIVITAKKCQERKELLNPSFQSLAIIIQIPH